MTMKALIVDDEKLIREGIRAGIPWEQLGITMVMTAASGQEALEVIGCERPEIIITDIQMAEMTGLELIAQTRKRFRDTRIIVLTGFDEFDYARECLRMQVQEFLLKPVDEEDLIVAIEEQIRAVEESRAKRENDEMTKAFLDNLLAEGQDEDHDLIVKVKEYINEHLADDVTVAKVASCFFLSPNYFSRLFKRVTGEGCNEYIVRKRMEQAQYLLATTNRKIGEIAQDVGYHDTNYFSLAFKKHTNISPGQYRSKIRQQRD